ncbi:MAG: AI-2E family transporter [Polyangiaceae bacterium]|nr:AI-2E family transporter [Polyangiaceae bacterium]
MVEPNERRAERFLFLGLVLAACWVVLSLLPWLLLALWVAGLVRPMHERVRGWVRGSERGAAIVVMGLTLAFIVPLGLVAGSLAQDAFNLGKGLLASEGGRAALSSLVSDGGEEGKVSAGRIFAILQQHGDRAWNLMSIVLTTTASVMIGGLMFLYGTYVSLVDGKRTFAWFKSVLPFSRETIERMAVAFRQTGRGLFIGVGVTGLVQSAVATLTYLALGVPRALVLGVLTFAASIVPSFGTALVWMPIAVGLALTGRPGAAIALAVVGVFVVGTVDNLLRPLIAHRADAHLPTFVVMLGMFGGLVALGGWGVLLGPLILRLAMEALELNGESTRGPVSAALGADEP